MGRCQRNKEILEKQAIKKEKIRGRDDRKKKRRNGSFFFFVDSPSLPLSWPFSTQEGAITFKKKEKKEKKGGFQLHTDK